MLVIVARKFLGTVQLESCNMPLQIPVYLRWVERLKNHATQCTEAMSIFVQIRHHLHPHHQNERTVQSLLDWLEKTFSVSVLVIPSLYVPHLF